jgi:hypothetical protein
MQFSKFAHKSLGSPISPSPLFFPLSLCSSSVRRLLLPWAAPLPGGLPLPPSLCCFGPAWGAGRAVPGLGGSSGALGPPSPSSQRRRTWAAAAHGCGARGSWRSALERGARELAGCAGAGREEAGGTGAGTGAAAAAGVARAKGARGSGVRRSGAARPGRARVQQQEEEE